MNTPTPLPQQMRPETVKQLLYDQRIELPARSRFSLGASGLSSTEVSALNVHNVTPNGVEVRSIITVPNLDGRRPHLGPVRQHLITDEARWLVGCWLETRRNQCAHHRTLMHTYRDEAGVLRCSACREVHDFLRVPLFNSRETDRMSARSIRYEFQRVRDILGLDPSYHFDTLREARLSSRFDSKKGQK
jgi:hypothetical protein